MTRERTRRVCAYLLLAIGAILFFRFVIIAVEHPDAMGKHLVLAYWPGQVTGLVLLAIGCACLPDRRVI